jgi:hypothetical protein
MALRGELYKNRIRLARKSSNTKQTHQPIRGEVSTMGVENIVVLVLKAAADVIEQIIGTKK